MQANIIRKAKMQMSSMIHQASDSGPFGIPKIANAHNVKCWV